MTTRPDVGNLNNCSDCGTPSMVTVELLDQAGIGPGSGRRVFLSFKQPFQL